MTVTVAKNVALKSMVKLWQAVYTNSFIYGKIGSFGIVTMIFAAAAILILTTCPLLSVAHRPLIVTCNTKGHGADGHFNICAGMKWSGFATKVSALEAFASRQLPTRLVVFLDSDVFANPSQLDQVEALYRSFDADVVLGGEQFCWIGRDCTRSDANLYYPHPNGFAPFANSGTIIARAGTLQSLLTSYVVQTARDDQLTWTELYKAGSFKIVIDTEMRLFASMCRARALRWYSVMIKRRTCVLQSLIAPHGCLYVPPKFRISRQCDVVEIGRENKIPVFWHGNGPSMDVWRKAIALRNKCLAAARAI